MNKITKIKMFDGSYGIIVENDTIKSLVHPKYNYRFKKDDGFFIRWGATKEDDGDMTLGLPEICDMEISTICNGVTGIGPCKFCYKGNTGKGHNMTFETFKKVFHNLPPTITQIAFGIGDIDGNPDMWNIFDYAKSNGVTPNVTINGGRMTPELFDRLASTCGAVAVSLYDKDLTYNAIHELTNRGLKQVNIHFMISNETYDRAIELMNDRMTDPRLAKLNAIVFLSLKLKGRAIGHYSQLSQERFKELTDYALNNNIPMGFDSCSAPKFVKSIKGRENAEQLEMFAEPCESSVYSCYISSDAKYYPCSFSECVDGWEDGIDVSIENLDFLQDVWYSNKVKEFSNGVINCRKNCKACPIYDI
jgi:hypothetical protein